MLHVRLAADGQLVDGRWHSVVIQGAGLPTPDEANTSAKLVDQLSHEDFGGVYHMEDDGRISG